MTLSPRPSTQLHDNVHGSDAAAGLQNVMINGDTEGVFTGAADQFPLQSETLPYIGVFSALSSVVLLLLALKRSGIAIGLLDLTSVYGLLLGCCAFALAMAPQSHTIASSSMFSQQSLKKWILLGVCVICDALLKEFASRLGSKGTMLLIAYHIGKIVAVYVICGKDILVMISLTEPQSRDSIAVPGQNTKDVPVAQASASPSSVAHSHDKATVVVTGIGPISSIGMCKADLSNSLEEGRVGISNIDVAMPDAANSRDADVTLGSDKLILECASKGLSQVASKVRNFALSNYVRDPDLLKVLTVECPARGLQLAIAAAMMAVKDANIDLSKVDRKRVGVYFATIGHQDFAIGLAQLKIPLSKRSGFMLHPHSAAAILSSMLDLKGPTETLLSGGCPAGFDTVAAASQAIRSGIIDIAICVAGECEVEPMTYSALLVSSGLTTNFNDNPKGASRPFDLRRNGSVCGEGGTALILESLGHARTRLAPQLYAAVAGSSKASTGRRIYNPGSAPSLDPDASVRAILGAIENAGWKPSEVSAVLANGSSSVFYDKIEAFGIWSALSEKNPSLPVFSIKGMIGQHGTSCTLLVLAAACLALYRKKLFGTVNFEEADPELPALNIVRRTEDAPQLEKILCQAISYGGFQYSVMALQQAPG